MLQIKVFTLRFNDEAEGFDDEVIRAFLADKAILSLNSQFFVRDNVPYWSVIAVYKSFPGKVDSANVREKQFEEKKDYYRSLLTEASTPLFNLLREWRNEKAKKEGLPPYILCLYPAPGRTRTKRDRPLRPVGPAEGFEGGSGLISIRGYPLPWKIYSNTMYFYVLPARMKSWLNRFGRR